MTIVGIVMMHVAFCIDFAVNGSITPLDKLEVLEYEPEDLAKELKEFNVTSVEELTDYDRCVFPTEEQASAFLQSYELYYQLLSRKNFCLDRTLPCLSYRKRNLVQTLMGYKLQTYRNYNRKWKPGQLFNLHDRTHFVTVELISCLKEGDQYCYRFKLPHQAQ